MVPHWNKILTGAITVNAFKKKIDKHFNFIIKKNCATIAGFRELPGFQ